MAIVDNGVEPAIVAAMMDTIQKTLAASDIAKGDVLYQVYEDRRDGPPSDVVVVSVGRDWITVGSNRTKRFRKDSLRSEDGRAKLWRNRGTYEAEIARESAWRELRSMVASAYKIPEGPSTEDILKAIELVRGKNA